MNQKMINVEGKIKVVPPNGHSVTNVKQFKIGDDTYLAVIYHYLSGKHTSVSIELFKKCSTDGIDSTLYVSDEASLIV